MGRRREEDERFDDLVYEAWRTGENPDLVSRDRYDGLLSRGFYPDEISLRGVLPTPIEPQEEYPYEEEPREEEPRHD